jgi:membrane fusion protein, multidrug efflux system
MSSTIFKSFIISAGWLIGISGLLLIQISCEEVKTEPAANGPGPVYVELHKLRHAENSVPIYVTGRVSSATSFDLSFRTGGFIEGLHVDEGDTVRKGQLLAALNRRETNAMVLRAENIYNKSRRDLSRLENLYRDNAATLEQLEDQKTQVEISRAELDIALFNQERASIIAPADGVVLQKRAEINEQVGQGQVVIRLGKTGTASTVVKAGVSDRDIQRLQLGDRALFSSDAFPEATFNGRISRIASEAQSRSGVFEIEITLDNSASGLRNGFIVNGRLHPKDERKLVSVPLSALVEADGRDVWIYSPSADNQIAERKKVRPLYIDDISFFVSASDLNGVERVITRGSAFLRPGSKIVTIDEVNP